MFEVKIENVSQPSSKTGTEFIRAYGVLLGDVRFDTFSDALEYVQAVAVSGWLRVGETLYQYQDYEITRYGILLIVKE